MTPITLVVGRRNARSRMGLTPQQQNGLDAISEQVHQVTRLDREAEDIRKEGAPNQRTRLGVLQVRRDAVARTINRVAEQHHT
jgi:hypothetical protein